MASLREFFLKKGSLCNLYCPPLNSALLKSLGEDERFFDLKIKYENRLIFQAVFVISTIGLIYGAP